MGCDIHAVVERKVGTRWVTIRTLDYPHPSRSRNYGRFAALAGVRGEGPEAKGIPADASDTARTLIDDWGSDGHSHSYLPIKDAAEIFLSTHWFNEEDEKRRDYITKYPASFFFDVDGETVRVCPTCKHRDVTGLDDFRLVFWFDN